METAMLAYTFITEPSADEIKQITGLYRLADWWDVKEPDDDEHVSRLVAGSHLFLVAQDEETVIGMGRALSDRVSDAYIQDITVHTTWRSRGIAKTIVQTLTKKLNHEGIHWIGLIAERGTRDLYRGLGFEEMPDAAPLLKKD
jgi:ribosomal protein S18 acetylase RimI-like enzyme